MATIDLDKLGARQKVKWKGKEYELRKFTVKEQPELDGFRHITEDNALELAKKGLELLTARFVEADEKFDVDGFKEECTFEMMNAIVTALTSAAK